MKEAGARYRAVLRLMPMIDGLMMMMMDMDLMVVVGVVMVGWYFGSVIWLVTVGWSVLLVDI